MNGEHELCGTSYWNKNGKYQKQADILDRLIPDEGLAQDTRGELFRRASNLYYELYNNGGSNMVYDDFDDDGDINALKTIGVELPTLRKHIEQYMIEDDDGNHIGDDEKYFNQSMVEMDIAMDKVIEYIIRLETNRNFKSLFKEIEK